MTNESLPPPKMPPGWYPDPEMVNTQRYWDGEAWTDNAAPMQQAARPQPQTQPIDDEPTLVVAFGWIGAVAFPIVGFVCGIILMTKGYARHGVLMLLVSLIASFLWLNELRDAAPYG